MDGGAVHRQRQRLADAGIFHPRSENQRHQAHRRGRPDLAPGRLAAQLAGTEFHHVRLAEFEIDGLVAQGPRRLDFHGVQERPAARGVFVGRVHGAPARFPVGDGEAPRQIGHSVTGGGRVGGFEGLPYFNAQRAAVVRAGGGRRGGRRERRQGRQVTCRKPR